MNLSSLYSSAAKLSPNVGDLVYNVGILTPDPNFLKASIGNNYSMTTYAALWDKVRFNYMTQSLTTSGTFSGTAPTADVYDVSWSPDGRYLAMVENGANKTIHIWDFSSGTPTKITSATYSNVTCCAWSADSRYLAIGCSSGTLFRIFDVTLPGFITNPSTQPSAAVNGITWSPDGTKIALGCNAFQYLALYNWSGGVATYATQPAGGDLPGSTTYKPKFSPDSKYLAVPFDGGPQFFVYDVTTSTPTKLTAPAASAGNGQEVAWTYNNPYMPTLGYYLAVGLTSTPYFVVYSLVSGVLTKMAAPAALLTGACRGIDWSVDGRVVSCATTSGYNTYDFNTGLPVLGTINNTGVVYRATKFSPDGRIIASGRAGGSPYYDRIDRFPISLAERFTFNLPTITYGWIRAILDS